jgi:hypothetical protein
MLACGKDNKNMTKRTWNPTKDLNWRLIRVQEVIFLPAFFNLLGCNFFSAVQATANSYAIMKIRHARSRNITIIYF